MTIRPSIFVLPPEILTLVFSSLDNLDDVSKLLSVSSTFRSVISSHAHPIYLAVAPRSTLGFEDAEILLETQEIKKQALKPTSFQDLNEKAVSRIKRLTVYAKLASKTCEVVGNLRVARVESHPVLNTHERTCFFRGFYQMWRLAETPLPNLRPLIAARKPQDLHRLLCISMWAKYVLDDAAAEKRGYVRNDWLAVEQAIRSHFLMKNVRIGGASAASLSLSNCFTMFEPWGNEDVYWKGDVLDFGERAARIREIRWRKRATGK